MENPEVRVILIVRPFTADFQGSPVDTKTLEDYFNKVGSNFKAPYQDFERQAYVNAPFDNPYIGWRLYVGTTDEPYMLIATYLGETTVLFGFVLLITNDGERVLQPEVDEDHYVQQEALGKPQDVQQIQKGNYDAFWDTFEEYVQEGGKFEDYDSEEEKKLDPAKLPEYRKVFDKWVAKVREPVDLWLKTVFYEKGFRKQDLQERIKKVLE